MPTIQLVTEIDAPIERCFDLSRSIDFHTVTATKSQEQAVGGVTSGLIGLGDTVTWRARHFGVWQHLTVQITQFQRPYHFQDKMLKGAFSSLRHNHHFDVKDGKTVMTDQFTYRSPLWILGYIADALFLRQYMKEFIVERNRILKACAESDDWQKYLNNN